MTFSRLSSLHNSHLPTSFIQCFFLNAAPKSNFRSRVTPLEGVTPTNDATDCLKTNSEISGTVNRR